MSDKEILDGAEKTLEVIEKRLENLGEDVENWYYFDKPAKIKFSIALGMIGTGIAVAAGTTAWVICKRRLTVQFDEHLEEQIRLTKEHYAKRAKVDAFATPETAAVELGAAVVTAPAEDKDQTHQDAVVAMRDYNSMSETTDEETSGEPEVKVEVNVFTQAMEQTPWDQDREDAWRAGLKPGDPYIISHEEFLQSEQDYNQSTLTYYAGDGVLADSTDDPIELIDLAIGEANLRFGHGSGDSRTVYIRNDRLEQDFEVVQSDGKFAHEVLGLQHSDELGSRHRDRHERRNPTRRFRAGDD